jgi:hypothetical protein
MTLQGLPCLLLCVCVRMQGVAAIPARAGHQHPCTPAVQQGRVQPGGSAGGVLQQTAGRALAAPAAAEDRGAGQQHQWQQSQ